MLLLVELRQGTGVAAVTGDSKDRMTVRFEHQEASLRLACHRASAWQPEILPSWPFVAPKSTLNRRIPGDGCFEIALRFPQDHTSLRVMVRHRKPFFKALASGFNGIAPLVSRQPYGFRSSTRRGSVVVAPLLTIVFFRVTHVVKTTRLITA